ncbi:MAG TPA: DNA methyltransferase, partial [Gaiellaceae bacterium]|nr:DNA methyltransferase [Gaiellaceae bacterium]
MAPTQEQLYAAIDLDLSWSERELPERERTKHVHRLHPYLGKFIPQLVEVLLARYVRSGGRVLDPFAGSGTTLVQGLESGYDAVGVDIAAFNCLLMRVKTRRYDPFALESELRDVVRRIETLAGEPEAGGYLGQWFAPKAAGELLAFRALLSEYEHADVLRVVLARAPRSAPLP